MSEPVCPFANYVSSQPKTVQEYMKKYFILRPPLDPRNFVPDEESPLFQVDTTPDIILHRYVEDSQLPSSLHQPPPSSQGMFCSQIFKQVRDKSQLENYPQSSVHTQSPTMPLQPSIFEESSPFLEPDDEGISEIVTQVGEHSLSEIELESNVETETPLSLSVREESVSTSLSSSSLTETSTDTESQSVESPAESEGNKTYDFKGRTLRRKDFLIENNIRKFQNAWKRNRENNGKRNVESESPELITPKRLKTSKATSDKVKPLSKTLPIIAKDSVKTKTVFKKPMSVSAKPWTEHEMECLVVGVNRYGHKWQEIHDAFNFHPSRTHKAMQHKFRAMNKKGDFQRYLKRFKKKAGYADITSSDTGGDSPTQSIDSKHLSPQPTSSRNIVSPAQSRQSVDISPSISFSPTISPNHDDNKALDLPIKYPQAWSQKEINDLEKGYEIYGPKWEMICRNYKINRSSKAIQKKYRKLHQAMKIKGMDRGASDSDNPKNTRRKKEKIKPVTKKVWSDAEIQYIVDGFKEFGPRWTKILESYNFHPIRTTNMLRRIYREMYPDYERRGMKMECVENHL